MRLFENKEPIRRLAILGVFLLAITACAHQGGAKTQSIKPKDWKIKVGPHPCTLADVENLDAPAETQVVSKGRKNKITWKTWKANENERVQLVFHVDPACPGQPFNNLLDLKMEDSSHYRLYALIDDKNGTIDAVVSDNACSCDLPNPADCDKVDPKDLRKWQIKYDQYIYILKGQVVISCDGMIIIDP